MTKPGLVCLTLLLLASGASAQTTVTTSGTTSADTIPMFGPSANSTVTNSPITVNGSYVGINTPSPLQALHITGAIRQDFNSNTGGTGYWILYPNDGAGNFNEYINSTGTTTPHSVVQGAGFRRVFNTEPTGTTDTFYYQYAISVAAGAAQSNWLNYMTINANASASAGTLNLMDQGGSVGIGTDAPVGQLANNSSNYGDLGTGLNSSSLNWTNNVGALSWNSITSAGNNGLLVGTTETTGTAFQVSSGTFNTGTTTWPNHLLTVLGSGNVGVGTTSPGYKLDVQGGQINSFGGYCINGSDNCITAWPTIGAYTWNNSQTFSSSVTMNGPQANGIYGDLALWATPGTYSNSVSTGNALSFMSNTSFPNQQAIGQMGLYQQTANADDLAAGVYLGIRGYYQDSGTSLPIAIGQGYSGSGAPSLYVAPGSNNGGGNVGIGTSNPDANLVVQSAPGLAPTIMFRNSDYASQSVGSGVLIGMGGSSGNTYGSVYAFNDGNHSYGNLFLGNGNVSIGTQLSFNAKLEVNGNVQVDTNNGTTGLVFSGVSGMQTTPWTGVLCGGDYAEAVDPAGDKQSYVPGDVLVITDDAGGEVRKSSEPYSTMVAGIYATKPGVVGRRESLPKDAQDLPMAMVGIVPTKVTTENGPIHRGDLLVTSSTPGFAMKGTDRDRMLGAVIGKAMGTVDQGSGVMEVLVTLQ